MVPLARLTTSIMPAAVVPDLRLKGPPSQATEQRSSQMALHLPPFGEVLAVVGIPGLYRGHEPRNAPPTPVVALS